MASKFKKFIRTPLTFILVLSIVLGTAYIPRESTPKAEAIFGIGDITITVNEVVRAIIDGVAMSIAQRMIDEMVASTMNWAQSGFEGSPAFVESPGGFLGDIANQEAGRYLNDLAGANLCSPFRPQIVLSLREYYNTRLGQSDNYSCTFTDIQGNFQAFLDGDFDQGGWDSWFQLTQNPSNNPYEVYLNAQGELDAKIASRVNTEITKLNWSGGFKNLEECLEYNSYIGDEDSGSFGPDDPPPVDGSLPVQGMRLKDENKGPNECIRFGNTKTPGVIIKDQLNNVLPSGLEKLISVEHIEGLISALATGLLNRYVFSDQGLTSKSAGAMSREFFDQDKDGIPDGYDYDYDGNLDACLHGLNNITQPPSNTNCIGSKDARSSEFYIPICEALQSTIHELEKFLAFLNANTWDKNKVRTWQDRTIGASGATDNLINVLMRHEVIDAPAYEPMLFTAGKYSREMDKIIKTLVEDEDLGDKGLLGLGGPGQTNNSTIRGNMIRGTANFLNYLKVQQSKIIGSCESPDTSNWGSTPLPVIDIVTGTSTNPTTPSGPAQGSSVSINSFCDADKNVVLENETITLSQTISDNNGPLPSNGSYTYSYTWMWGTSAQGAFNGENMLQTKTSNSSSDATSVSFSTPGDFYMAIQAIITDSGGATVAAFVKNCNAPVTVLNGTQAN